jgi:MFS family permease
MLKPRADASTSARAKPGRGRLKLNPMTALERRSVGVLAAIYGLRIAGLFLIFPVFALYAAALEGHTPFLIGMALGVYGLTQAILQIPLGALSDRIGRKPVIALGLVIFAIGSVVAALSDSIWGVILGRAIQGAGAIAAAAMAMVADLTREEQRTKAMALIGITIGATFILSMVVGPLLNRAIGVPGIFWLTALFALIAAVVLLVGVPTPKRSQVETAGLSQFRVMLKDAQLMRLNFGIFVLHLVLTALFVALPGVIVQYGGLPVNEHWRLYLPVMLVAIATMAPFIRLGNHGRGARAILISAAAVLMLAEAVFALESRAYWGLVIGLWLFFTAFNLLEALLPSLVSRVAPAQAKGAAIGIYSTSQFLGAFVGGALGGALLGLFGPTGVFWASATLLLALVVVNVWMPMPRLLTTHTLRLPREAGGADDLAGRLSRLPGVAEAVVLTEERVAYLKVDPAVFDEAALEPYRPESLS